MLKFTAVVSLMLIGSTLWAAGLSCDSCGIECASACGTRHFRACCFNYLRRKRGPEGLKLWSPDAHDTKTDYLKKPKTPLLSVKSMPESWALNMAEFEPYGLEDTNDNRLQVFYDA